MGIDIYQLLRRDHAKLRELIGRLRRTSGDRKALFHTFKAEFDMHDLFEREVFYPAIELDDDTEATVDHAIEQHDEITALIEDIASGEPADDDLDQLLFELEKGLEEHIAIEERTLFALAERILEGPTAEDIAQKYRSARATMM